MTAKKRAAHFGLAVLLGFLASEGTAQKKPHITGFFTNMEYLEEAGDVVGMEVWIVYGGGRYWATVQVAQGTPDPPIVVPATVNGPVVSFSVQESTFNTDGSPAQGDAVEFKGTVTATGIVGSFANQRIRLRRGNSYWQ